MMPGRMGIIPPLANENPLGLSWHDSAWIPMLNPSNVMDYFAERSNPFYDRSCNNEMVKMQRLNPEQLTNMTGLEYVLLHVQEPILYVIRKRLRHSPTHTVSLADYYIVAGIIYQAPDLASVLNSRLLSTIHHLQASFEETASYARYHPSKGYSWDFKPNKLGLDRGITGNGNSQNGSAKEPPSVPKEEPSTAFQRQRVDMLLAELARQFPFPATQQAAETKPTATIKTEPGAAPEKDGLKSEIKSDPSEVVVKREPGEPPASESDAPPIRTEDIKQEPMKPPPEKKPRLN